MSFYRSSGKKNASSNRAPKTRDEVNPNDWRRFVLKRAWNYATTLGGLDDAEAVAWLGFAIALNKWDPSRGAFATVADLYIKEALGEAADKQQRLNGIALKNRTNGKILQRMGRSVESFRDQEDVKLVPGNARVGNDPDGPELQDYLADETPNAEERLGDRQEEAFTRDKLLRALATLDERERHVVRCRYLKNEDDARRGGRYGGHSGSMTFADNFDSVAVDLNLTRERIRQIEQRALAKLRAALEGKQFSSGNDAMRAYGMLAPLKTKRTPETRARLAAEQSARMTPEARAALGAKISAAQKARWAARTPEERAAIAAKKRATLARRKSGEQVDDAQHQHRAA